MQRFSPHYLIRRLVVFLTPLALGIAVSGWLVMRFVGGTGELMPVAEVAALQMKGEPFLYLAKFSDHIYRLKLEAVRLRHPQVLALGNSRSNQWRSAMFYPESFYNASGALFGPTDYRRFLEEMEPPYPRVMIVLVDFYMFGSKWPPQDVKSRAFDDLDKVGEQVRILLRVGEEIAAGNWALFFNAMQEKVYGAPAIGLAAADRSNGYRLDGSYQDGRTYLGYEGLSDADILERVVKGQAPFLFGDALDRGMMAEFETFVALAKSKGIRVVAVTMPWRPPVLESLDQSSKHAYWHAFHSQSFRQWLVNLGVLFFDFSRIESFDGRAEEFTDPVHPAETSYVRVLLKMLETPEFAALFPQVNGNRLREYLTRATLFEVFRNEF